LAIPQFQTEVLYHEKMRLSTEKAKIVSAGAKFFVFRTRTEEFLEKPCEHLTAHDKKIIIVL